jgi:hypothetical protein
MLLNQVRNARSSPSGIIPKITRLGPTAIPSLVSAFKDPDDRVRLTAIRALSSLPETLKSSQRDAVTAVTQLLKDSNLEVRYRAALLLARMGPDAAQAVPSLRILLRSETPGNGDAARLQQVAAYTLGRIGSAAREVAGDLPPLLAHPSSNVRQEVIVCTWRITHDTNLLAGELRRMLDERSVIGANAALAAIRHIGREVTLDPSLIAEIENRVLKPSPNVDDISRAEQ